jgi:acetylornithine deacetylase
MSGPDRPTTDWSARVLAEVDARLPETFDLLAELVRIPSVSGTDPEHEIQARLADELAGAGLEVDHWRIPLDELMAEPEFPGVEVERQEAWGLVGRLPASSSGGGSLLLNGHVDVVPIGNPVAWSRPDAFSGQIVGDTLFGRGACDMKAGLVAALAAVQAVRRVGVPLRGELMLPAFPVRRTAASGATRCCAVVGGPMPASCRSRPDSIS